MEGLAGLVILGAMLIGVASWGVWEAAEKQARSSMREDEARALREAMDARDAVIRDSAHASEVRDRFTRETE